MQIWSQDTRFGLLTVIALDGAITSVEWADHKRNGLNVNGLEAALLREALAQLVAYDRGDLQDFGLLLGLAGSPFQQAVCAAMSRNPIGYTVTYGNIARELDASARAVGASDLVFMKTSGVTIGPIVDFRDVIASYDKIVNLGKYGMELKTFAPRRNDVSQVLNRNLVTSIWIAQIVWMLKKRWVLKQPHWVFYQR